MRRHLNYANVMATVAVFVALGGGAYAVSKVGTGNIKKGAVTAQKLKANAVITKKIKDGAVTTPKLIDGAVTGDKVDESSLGAVPSALTLDGLSSAAFERTGRIAAGSVATTDPTDTRVILAPSTGADVRLGNSVGTVSIVNTNSSLPMQVAGLSGSGGGATEPEFATIPPSGSTTFSYSTQPPTYLDLMIVVSGASGPATLRSHLTCGAVNGSGGRPSTLSCVSLG